MEPRKTGRKKRAHVLYGTDQFQSRVNTLPADNTEREHSVVRYFRLAMPFVYLGTGLLLLFTGAANTIISPDYRAALAGVLIAYSAFRFYLFLKPKNNPDD